MILTINGGSSSIKFSLYKTHRQPEKLFSGQISSIGSPDIRFAVSGEQEQSPCKGTDYASAIVCLIDWLKEKQTITDIEAIGHRVVHGMEHTEPALITTALLQQLKVIIPYDPDHLPSEIKLIQAFREQYPKVEQFACFDTGFHNTMPQVAKQLPIPRRFVEQGIRRYGFHGLSYRYLVQELGKIAGKKRANGRLILLHLGSGASLCAVYNGKSVDTSMGFTPAGGIPMSTRSGDLDPGIAWVMMKTEKLSPAQFNHVVNHESGLLGVSGTSGDMSKLLLQKTEDEHAADAVELFCYQVKKQIGAFAAVLGGVDALVFAGGIGENAPVIRTRICQGLGFLGIELSDKQNAGSAKLISKNKSTVPVFVIPTNEELMIARIVIKMIGRKHKKSTI